MRYGEGYSVVPRPVFANGLLFVASGFDRPILYAIDPKGATATRQIRTSCGRTKKAPRSRLRCSSWVTNCISFLITAWQPASMRGQAKSIGPNAWAAISRRRPCLPRADLLSKRSGRDDGQSKPRRSSNPSPRMTWASGRWHRRSVTDGAMFSPLGIEPVANSEVSWQVVLVRLCLAVQPPKP